MYHKNLYETYYRCVQDTKALLQSNQRDGTQYNVSHELTQTYLPNDQLQQLCSPDMVIAMVTFMQNDIRLIWIAMSRCDGKSHHENDITFSGCNDVVYDKDHHHVFMQQLFIWVTLMVMTLYSKPQIPLQCGYNDDSYGEQDRLLL